METKVKLPQMGESVVEGTIVKWLKKEGDLVERDEFLVEISTDKVDTEIPSPAKGRLSQILAKEGETIQVGQDIAVIAEEEEGVAKEEEKKKEPEKEEEPAEEEKREAFEKAEKEKPKEKAAEEKTEEKKKKPIPEKKPSLKTEEKRITPVVAKMASEHNIDLDKIKGTGINERVTKRDVLDYLEKQGIKRKEKEKPKEEQKEVREEEEKLPGGEEEIIEMSKVRKSIAEHMIRSKQTSPHVTTVVEVDMTRVVDFREGNKEKFKSENNVPLTYTAIIVRAAVNSLKRFPLLNSSLKDDKIIIKKYYNIGVATAAKQGLIVPVIKRAERLDIKGIAKEIFELAEKAREGKLPLEALLGGTFTITNPGVYGAIFSTPIIHQPQAAILGVEAIRRLPAALDDAIAIRSKMNLCLSYDHRIIDGMDAGKFLQDLKRELEERLKLEI